ncbi:MAG: DapH/DapD/GlmU-related protein [Pseudomonadota bacterium]
MLRLFGASIARDVHVYPTVRIAIPWNLSIGPQSAVGDRAILYALGPITLGEKVTVSQYAHLCAGSHDFARPDLPLTKPPITLEREVWVGADAFVGPGVSVGERAMIGARAVVMKAVPAGVLVIGNPARVLRNSPLAGGVA